MDRSPAPRGVVRNRLDLVLLLAANLLPLVAVIWFGWRPGDVLIAYWLETIAVAGWTVPRILTAKGDQGEGEPGSRGAGLRRVGSFLVLYLVLAGVQSWFLVILFGERTGVVTAHGIAWSATLGYAAMFLAFVVSHGAAFVDTWMRGGEAARTPAGVPVRTTIGRVLALQAVILALGSLLDAGWGESALVVAAVGLVLLKLAAELIARWWRSRRGSPDVPGYASASG